jgi:hypothetical protein
MKVGFKSAWQTLNSGTGKNRLHLIIPGYYNRKVL